MYPDEDAKNKKRDIEDKDKAINQSDDLSNSVSSTVNTGSLARDTNDSQNQALLDIKQQALTQLGDLVDNLDQSPEQHFRTLMMIIQETDNAEIIDKAYSTALLLKDPKERAQALLAIANEINYFTSK